MQFASYLEQAGRHEQATAIFLRAHNLFPDDAFIIKRLSMLYLLLSRKCVPDDEAMCKNRLVMQYINNIEHIN